MVTRYPSPVLDKQNNNNNIRTTYKMSANKINSTAMINMKMLATMVNCVNYGYEHMSSHTLSLVHGTL